MALALTNPNYKRTINRLARLVANSDLSPKQAVALWAANKDKPAQSRDPRLRRDEALAAALKASKSGKAFFAGKKQDPAKRRVLAQMKRAVAKEFTAQLTGYGPWVRKFKNGKTRTKSFASRAVGVEHLTYLSKSKRTPDRKARQAGISAANTRRQSLRAQYGKGHARGAALMLATASSKRPYQPKWQATAKGAAKSRAGRGSKRAAANPGYGALALTNPDVSLMGLASAAASGVAGGAVLFYIVPTAQEWWAKVPVVGETIADKIPHFATGAVVGAGATLAAGKLLDRRTATYTAAAAAALAIVGAGIDVVNFLSSRSSTAGFGALALTPELAGLGFENLGALALENGGYGDGMAWETASLASSPSQLDFSGASYADAAYSGPDFTAREGQSILSNAYGAEFGPVPRRNGNRQAGPSHLAGRAGLRWAWLGKMIGWDKVRAIAALPPKKRLPVIQSLRGAALKAYYSEMKNQQASDAAVMSTLAPQEPSVSAGFGAGGAIGAGGATGPGDLGAAVFVGE